jgi:hypothetical protein
MGVGNGTSAGVGLFVLARVGEAVGSCYYAADEEQGKGDGLGAGGTYLC